jgi:hypothetical protein
MNRPADAFDDQFEPEDEFETFDDELSNGADPFLDAAAIERRMLGEDPIAEDRVATPSAAPNEEPGVRPFGARLAEANIAPLDEFGDAEAFDSVGPVGHSG